MDPQARAIIREMKRHLAQMRQRGQLKRQLARLRLTTAEAVIRKGRRA
jgi:RecB family endonuclease NucS